MKRSRSFAAVCAIGAFVMGFAGIAAPSHANAPVPFATGGATPSVTARGSAPKLRSHHRTPNAPIVDIATDPSGDGYWLAASDGGVFSVGHARFRGSASHVALRSPIVAIAATPTGRGYWLVASDGGVFSFGDAHYFGSLGSIVLNAPIVAIAPAPHGRGYWLVASDGGVFAFGRAKFRGSAAPFWKNGSVVDIAPTASGHGYELLVSDGAVFSFGNAPRLGNPTRGAAAVAIVRSPHAGYWVVARDGRVVATHGASNHGGSRVSLSIAVGLAPRSDGNGYWIATVPPGPPAPANSGLGRRIIYSISAQRVWTVEANNSVSHFWKVSGKFGLPPVGTFHILSRSVYTYVGSLRLNYMQRFYQTVRGGWVGFHGIPLRPDGTPIESDAQLGTPLSHGCVRMNQTDVKTLWDWAPMGTTVVVLP